MTSQNILNNLNISTNGRCGTPFNNTKCPIGNCCSYDNWCGYTKDHCSNINKQFHNLNISTDGRCGLLFNNTKCPNGSCCSSDINQNWCGNTSEHCDNINKSYDGDNNITNDNSLNLEKINLNIDNFNSNDKYKEFLNNAQNNLFDNNTFPYNSFINKSNINNIVDNTILKRACCMRKYNTDKFMTIYVNLYDNNTKTIKSYPMTIDNLDVKCSNIDNKKYEPKNQECDNFYKTYCKMLKSFNYDLNNSNDKENYNKNIKYSNNKDNTNGLECSCLNSPLYDFNKTDIKENNIYHMDKACNSGINNNNSYETDTISKNKVSTLNICSINLGNNIDALKANISNNYSSCNITNNTGTSNTGNSNTGTSNTGNSNTVTSNTGNSNTKTSNTDVSKDTKTSNTDVSKDTKSNTNTDKDTSKDTTKNNYYDIDTTTYIIIGVILGFLFIMIIFLYKNKRR